MQNTSPKFVVQAVDGTLAGAPLERLDDTGTLQIGGETPRTLTRGDWYALRREHATLPPFPTKDFLLLTSGERIPLAPGSGFRVEEERFFFSPESGPEISVPLAYVAIFCVRPAEGADDPELFLAGLDRGKRARDVLYLKSGDRIEGALAPAPGGRNIALNIGDRTVDTPLEQLAVLAMNTELQARPRPKKTLAHVITTHGGACTSPAWRLDVPRGVLAGKTVFGAKLDVPLDQLCSLSLHKAEAVYLSELKPVNVQQTPFFGVRWPLVLDAAVTGKQLALNKSYYDKGLGMHAQTRIAYALEGNYRWFEALVGLDERSGRLGSARVSVLVDSQVALERKELAALPLPVRINVLGVDN